MVYRCDRLSIINIYLWNMHEFFTISSSFLNYTGVGLLLLLTL